MFDINALFAQAITTVVEQALTTVRQEYANKMGEMAQKIAELETKLVEAALFDKQQVIEALNSQEWFWEKLSGFISKEVEDAIDTHCSDYDHDDYDRIVGVVDDLEVDEMVKKDDMRSEVQDVLNDASFEVRVSI